jgi:hypothetical protein
MKLDELFIAFKAEGATELLKNIRTINSALDETVKKYTSVSAQMSRLTAQFQKGINSSKIKDNARKNLSMYEMEIRKLKEIVGLREKAASLRIRGITSVDALAARRMLDSKGAITASDEKDRKAPTSSTQGLQAIAKLSVITNKLLNFTQAMGAQMRTDLKAARTFYNNILLSGVVNRRAVGAGINIARYGGTAEEVLASDRSISTSLGALSRGDTSLIQHLGRFGIGGIMPNMSPEEVRSIITSKVRSKTLSANELNALMAGLPYSDAEKAQMLEGTGSIYSNAYSAFKTKSENDQKLLDAADAQIKGYENAQEMYDSRFFDSVNWMANFMKSNPWANTLQSITKEVGSLVVELAALKTLGGSVGKGGLPVKVASFLGGTALAAVVGAMAYEFGNYLYNKTPLGRYIEKKLGIEDYKYRAGGAELTPQEKEYRKEIDRRHQERINNRKWLEDPYGSRTGGFLLREALKNNSIIEIDTRQKRIRDFIDLERQGVFDGIPLPYRGATISPRTVSNNNSTNITNNYYQGDGFRLSDFQDMYSPVNAIY